MNPLTNTLESFELITEAEILEANRRWDQANGNPHEAFRIRSAWNEAQLLKRGKLTDKKISQYEREGYFTQELRDARREWQAMKTKKRSKREGNFELTEGRLIFRP